MTEFSNFVFNFTPFRDQRADEATRTNEMAMNDTTVERTDHAPNFTPLSSESMNIVRGAEVDVQSLQSSCTVRLRFHFSRNLSFSYPLQQARPTLLRIWIEYMTRQLRL